MKTTFVVTLFSLLSWCTSLAFAVPRYEITTLGFTDAEHTRNDGYRFYFGTHLSADGQVVGSSERFNGGSNSLGQTVWHYDGTATINIGLTDPEHTRNDGFKQSGYGSTSDYRPFSALGQIIGGSIRYNGGSSSLGATAWIYDGITTNAIGLVGPEYIRNDGYRASGAIRLNNVGQVLGFSERYNGGSSSMGGTAWIYDGITTNAIGLVGPEHTRNDGYKYNRAELLSEAGYVAGSSLRYNGGSSLLGESAWLYDGVMTLDIGLTGAEHTRNDGYKKSGVYSLSETGSVTGYSQRFNSGGIPLGQSAWIYNGIASIDIGLTGADFTRNDGYKYSYTYSNGIGEQGYVLGGSYRYRGSINSYGNAVWLYNGTDTIDIGLTGPEHTNPAGLRESYVNSSFNQANQVIGVSTRFDSTNSYRGKSAWIYNGITTLDIGLTGPEYTSTDGVKESETIRLNNAGEVIGSSRRFSGNIAQGITSWLYDGVTTFEIGLIGSEYTRNDGIKINQAIEINEAGQVYGHSLRFNGESDWGQDAWFYDLALDQTFILQLSTRSDGYAFSVVEYLSDDGLALGTYELFDEFDNNLGLRAFSFSLTDGLHDLGSLVDGSLSASGWEFLAYSVSSNALGQIIGRGNVTSQLEGQTAFLLTPIVPEPNSIALVGTWMLAAVIIRRRERCGKGR